MVCPPSCNFLGSELICCIGSGSRKIASPQDLSKTIAAHARCRFSDLNLTPLVLGLPILPESLDGLLMVLGYQAQGLGDGL